MKLILTVEEIRSLAIFAGIAIDNRVEIGPDELETEFTVARCAEDQSYRFTAWVTDYPEEGAQGLGRPKEPA